MVDLQAPDMRATISDVAGRAGVSTATVSRVINETGPVAESTADRVWRAISELNYAPHSGARELAGGRSSTLGLILTSAGGYFAGEVLAGIEAGAGDAYDLLIYAAQKGPAERQAFYLPLNEHNTGGLIVTAGSLPDEALVELSERSLPLVLLFQSSPNGLALPSVSFENEAGVHRIVEHLIAVHGYREIAFLSGPPQLEDAGARLRGYRQALADHNIEFDEKLVAQGGYNAAMAETAVSRWLDNGILPRAIVAADDESAMGTLSALHAARVRVPHDVAVVGFDDAPLSRHLSPPLTTVRAPIEAAGEMAARLLRDLIESGTADLQTKLPTEVVVRQSCGCE
jgi:DNA-binding LacI/PurR family transcriptional regulator